MAAVCLASAQTTTFPVNGTVDKHTTYTAFTNATVRGPLHPDSKRHPVGEKRPRRRRAPKWNSPKTPTPTIWKGCTSPSFIDLHSQYGLPRMERKPWEPYPQYESNTKGAYGWNQAVKPETDAAAIWTVDEKKAKGSWQAGVGVVLTHQQDGIFRGTGAVVMLGSDENTSLIQPGATTHASFSKGTSRQSYPGSLMGSIALLRRQTLHGRRLVRHSPTAAKPTSRWTPYWSKWNCLRSLKWAAPWTPCAPTRWATRPASSTSSKAAATSTSVTKSKPPRPPSCCPLDFPKAYDVSDPFNARMVSLADMKHWEQAPTNPARLADAGGLA